MSTTLSTGPTITTGTSAGIVNGPADSNVLAGPNIEFQGGAILDVRYPVLLPADRVGSVKAHLDSPYILMVDAVPSTAASAAVAALQNVTSGTAMTLVSAVGTGIAVNLPLYIPATGGTATSGVSLDYGFSTINVTSGSATATPASGTINLYSPGMQVVICANATPQINTVVSVGSSTVTLLYVANATNSAAAIGIANVRDPLSPATATCSEPYVAAGVAAMFNPLEGLCRGVSITGSTSATGGAFKVVSYDIYGQAMTETITVGAGAVTAYGSKAHKHIISVTPQFTDAHNYSVGTSDLFGINLRSDKWEYANFYWAGAFLTTSAGWTAAVTSTATSTTGDVRGTLQIGTVGPGGSGASGGASNGSRRLALFMTIPAYNLTAATISNTAPLYGVTQA